MHRDDATLLDILQAADDLLREIEGQTQQGFLGDFRLRCTVLYQLLLIGEAVKRLSREFRLSCPQVEWSAIAGMRDRLIHSYDQIDLELVWAVATTRVPELREVLEPLAPPREEPR